MKPEKQRRIQSDGGVNRAEQLVYSLSRRSFLSLWSYVNPRGKNKKELCDILVVCEPDVLIISVKEIDFTGAVDSLVDQERWQRRAIDASSKQIYGAERWLSTAPTIIRADGAPGLPLPKNGRRIHRIAIAMGGNGQTFLRSGDFGKGFVHVFDERSLLATFQELDTISDFIAYLLAKEKLLRQGVRVLMVGAEEDLLALYLHRGRSFPEEYNAIVVDQNLWRGIRSKPEWRARKDADRESYIWDRLIEILTRDISSRHLEFGVSITEAEVALRVMAREDRFSRRLLAKSMHQFANKQIPGARFFQSPSGVAYVFLMLPIDTNRAYRADDLSSRCFVARGEFEGAREVIGIGTEVYDWKNGGSSFDLIYFRKDTWDAQDQVLAEKMKVELGYLQTPTLTHQCEDEYPVVTSPANNKDRSADR